MFNVKEVNDGKEANLSQLNASRSGATMAQVKKSLKKSQLFENRKFLKIATFWKSQLFDNRFFFKSQLFENRNCLKIVFFENRIFFENRKFWKSHFFENYSLSVQAPHQLHCGKQTVLEQIQNRGRWKQEFSNVILWTCHWQAWTSITLPTGFQVLDLLKVKKSKNLNFLKISIF